MEGIANKYIVKGESDITPIEYFRNKSAFLKESLINHRSIKFRFVLVCIMEMLLFEGEKKTPKKFQDKGYFQSDTHINLESTDVKEVLDEVIQTILENINIYQMNGSWWYFKEIVYLEIHTVDYKPMRGGAYIPLPEWIMRKKAIINIRNDDNKCFIWCVLRYLNPRGKNDFRLTDLRKYEKSLKTKGIRFPVKIQDISNFENLNPDLPGINVFSADENKKLFPLRMAKRNPEETIGLFLYEKDGNYHYSLIKNFSRLFRSQITSRTNEKICICKRCFSHFSKEELFKKHIEYCSINETVAVKMPPKKKQY